MANKKHSKDCENCYYFRDFGDESDNLKKDCTYELEPDYDKDGFKIDEPPCDRQREERE